MGSANSKLLGTMLPVEPGGAEVLRLVERAAVDGVVGGQPHPPVVPGRLGIPLVEEIEVEGPDPPGEGELEVGIPLHLLRLRGVQEVRESTSPRFSMAIRVVASGTLL